MTTPCPVAPCDVWAIKDFVAPLTSALTAFIVAGIGYALALRQLRHKNAIDVQDDLRKRQADALKAAWALLQYLTRTDNGTNIIKIIQPKKGSGVTAECSYLIHMGNAQTFVFEALPQAFYAQGAGLLWPSSVKEHFCTARSIIYGVLLAEGMAHAPELPLQPALSPDLRALRKEEAAKKLLALYDTLNHLLRKEVQTVYGIF